MADAPDNKPDPLDQSLGDQATGTDASRADRDVSLGGQETTGEALSSQSDISGDLSAEPVQGMPIVDLAERYEIEGVLGGG